MEELDPSKFHTLNMKYKKMYIAGVLLLVLVVVPLVSFMYYKAALTRPAQGHKEASFEIFDGESVSSIADRLYEGALINSSFLFKAHLVSQGLHTQIQAGIYRISAGSTIDDLSELFLHGTNDIAITFLEGWRAEEYARHAAASFKKVDYQDFLALSREKEGYLFPDTYFFKIDTSEEKIVEVLKETFEEKTSGLIRQKDLDVIGLTELEVITFASIVEREVFDENDRPVVAGILIDRFKNGELIGADATTQYATAHLRICNPIAAVLCPTAEEAAVLDWWPADITLDELNWDSPYNTRKNVGLPPKPISNPSISAIESVLNYQETPYNFYLTDDNGITHYAVTLDEHNENVARHLR
ncbi:endolytic transglycosylase MltG [candidate division WWE3 bacterium]|jgi:UPF0755 protein|nr:endolytic transglycosylase MltG [candidate division WWE3 bacterium]